MGSDPGSHLCLILPQSYEAYCCTPQDIKEAYALFDKEGKGRITLQDLKDAANQLGEKVSEEQLQVCTFHTTQ